LAQQRFTQNGPIHCWLLLGCRLLPSNQSRGCCSAPRPTQACLACIRRIHPPT
jgi:hypothetical protein